MLQNLFVNPSKWQRFTVYSQWNANVHHFMLCGPIELFFKQMLCCQLFTFESFEKFNSSHFSAYKFCGKHWVEFAAVIHHNSKSGTKGLHTLSVLQKSVKCVYKIMHMFCNLVVMSGYQLYFNFKAINIYLAHTTRITKGYAI